MVYVISVSAVPAVPAAGAGRSGQRAVTMMPSIGRTGVWVGSLYYL